MPLVRPTGNPATYAAGNVVALAGADKWSDGSSNPKTVIDHMRQTVRRKIGRKPGSRAIGSDAFDALCEHRDVAVVDTSIVDVRSSAVYAVVYGGLVVAKRIQINRDGSILLSSDNKAAGYQDERVSAGDLHELHIAGRIKGRVGGL